MIDPGSLLVYGRRIVFRAILAGFLLVAGSAADARKISFIRDAEIEDTIRVFSAPLFLAAGLDPASIRIYLVNDKSLNAFVAGGQKLFIHTGLIMRTENPGQLIGVISHETGHISGGHLTRMHDAIAKATATQIVATILGGIAAAGSGRSEGVGAAIVGGQSVGLRSFLQFSRTQESAADHAGLKYLDDNGWSAQGLLEFLTILQDQDLLSTDRQDPYMRTHPLTRERFAAVEAHVANSPFTKKAFPKEFIVRHERMRAKLIAFMDTPGTTLRRYPESDTGLEARYARAIAHYRKLDLDKAHVLVDQLIAENPGDPYFHELKGQMLFEHGRGAEALGPYETAVKLLPSSPLLRADLAKVQLERGDPAYLDQAIANLQMALSHDPESPFNWRQLAIAHGRKGDEAMSAVALGEEALLQGKPDIAKFQAGKAERLLPHGSRGWLQAQDIRQAAEEQQKKLDRE
jgi:predicted Zn-dependent protease